MLKKSIYLFSLSLVLAACSVYHITSEEVTPNYYPSKRLASEVVHLTSINRPHEIIATITVNTERRQYLSDVIEKMKREAAVLGGDAIANLQTDATGTWKNLPVQDVIGNAYVRANFTASVVVFK